MQIFWSRHSEGEVPARTALTPSVLLRTKRCNTSRSEVKGRAEHAQRSARCAGLLGEALREHKSAAFGAFGRPAGLAGRPGITDRPRGAGSSRRHGAWAVPPASRSPRRSPRRGTAAAAGRDREHDPTGPSSRALSVVARVTSSSAASRMAGMIDRPQLPPPTHARARALAQLAPTADRRPPTADRRPPTADWRSATGDRRPATHRRDARRRRRGEGRRRSGARRRRGV